MDEQQEDGLERGDEPPCAKPMLSGWNWWPEHQDELIRRRKTEMDQLRALNWALGRIFDDKSI